MESLIDIDTSPTRPATRGNNGSAIAAPSVDLLLEGSIQDEARLGSCPVLDADAYDPRGPPASPREGTNIQGQDSPSMSSVMSTSTTTIDNDSNASPMDTHAPVPIFGMSIEATTSLNALTLPDCYTNDLVGRATHIGIEDTHYGQLIEANFVLSHPPGVEPAVLGAVHEGLVRIAEEHHIELQCIPRGSYLKLIAPRKNMVELVGAAQDLADSLTMKMPSNVNGIFLEPPTRVNSGSQVILHDNPLGGGKRPKLELGQETAVGLEVPVDPQNYLGRLRFALYTGLKKAGGVPGSLALKVNLGQFILQSYPRSKLAYEYHDFQNLMKNPRVSGLLQTEIGHKSQATEVLDFVRRGGNGLLQPIRGQITSPADVLPEYAFEIHSNRIIFTAPIKMKGIEGARGAQPKEYSLYQVTACRGDDSFPELDVKSLGLGKNLDWGLVAVTEEKGAKAFPEVVKYLRSAKIELIDWDEPHDPSVYPNVALPFNETAKKFKNIAVKTIYRFRWKSTSYIVQIAINHRWDSVATMQQLPTVDLGISVTADNWNSVDGDAGNNWGNELEFLLDGHEGGGAERANSFIQTIGEIRDCFDAFF